MDTINVQDIVNGLPEGRREKVRAEAQRITNESLKQGAQELLEDYYTERDRLTGNIATFEKALSSAKEELKNLHKKNKKLLKQTESFKSKVEIMYEFIRDNPGLLSHEITTKIAAEKDVFAIAKNNQSLSVYINNIYERGMLEKREGLFYVKAPFSFKSNKGSFSLIKEALLLGPKNSNDIHQFALETNKICSKTSIRGCIYTLIQRNKVKSNATYKHQKDVVYTWIGER